MSFAPISNFVKAQEFKSADHLKFTGMITMIQPLYLVASTQLNTIEVRRFAVDQLRRIAASTGVRQASLCADTAFDSFPALISPPIEPRNSVETDSTEHRLASRSGALKLA